jgi:peptidoglycan/xylan/chitin deacetylase (PgdA/CDA1 family)
MLRHPGFRDAPRALTLGLLANFMHLTGLSHAGLALIRGLMQARYIRVVNYHGTPARHAASLRRQFEFYRRHFVPVSRAGLEELLEHRCWSRRTPGLLISFDDGLRDNFDVAAPLLDEYGLTGWFFVPTGFISVPAEQQADFARTHRITPEPGVYSDGRVAMSWDEIRILDRHHVVGCHSRNHLALGAGLSASTLEEEISQSKRELERELGHPVAHFCWVGGEESSYSVAAAREIRRTGYRYGFMTNSAPVVPGTPAMQIQRTNVEAAWPLPIVKFQLSGVLDVLYGPKRSRVKALTAA